MGSQGAGAGVPCHTLVDGACRGVRPPCFQAFLFPCGGPGDLPPCSLHRPFGIAGDWHGFPDLLERARHRGARCMGKGGLCMRLFIASFRARIGMSA